MAFPLLASLAKNPWKTAAAGIGVAQGIVNMVPTAYDRRNREQIKELKEREERGELGMSDEERNLMQSQLQQPVRNQATQALNQQAAMMSALGNTSAAAQSRLQNQYAQQLGDAAMGAQRQVQQANLDAQMRNKAELEQRMANREARRTDRVNGLFNALGGAAEVLGAESGAKASGLDILGKLGTDVDLSELRNLGFDDEMIAVLDVVAQRDPKLALKLINEQRAYKERE